MSHVEALAHLFRMAALSGVWEPALRELARICGGHAAQLIGVGPSAIVPFNRAYNLDPDALREFVERDGGDPRRNARVRHGLKAPLLQPLTEADFDDVDEVLKSELYADLFGRNDILYNLQATLMRGREGVVGLAVMHSQTRGVATAEERERFAAIVPHVRDAVRLQMALEGRGARVLKGSLEALGAPAFICSAEGRVRAMTTSAEAMVRSGEHLTVTRGRLAAAHPQDAPRLEAALQRANLKRAWDASSSEVVLRAADGSTLVCEVAPLPLTEFPLGLGASSMVVARPARGEADLAERLAQTYGLTQAECEIAAAVAAGRSPAEIAQARGVAVGTVRGQLKTLAAKLGVSRQAEVAALVARLRL